MKAHIVLAHPETKSFNGHLSDTTQRVLGASGWQHTLSDLYAMDFDPREGPPPSRSRKDADVRQRRRHAASSMADTLSVQILGI